MFYDQNFSNALLKFIMRFILSVTDLYSAAIRFEREFADDFDEPAPSVSPGEEVTERATGESPCASEIRELPAPVVSPHHRFRPSHRHPHMRPAAQRHTQSAGQYGHATRGEPNVTGRWPASVTRLPSIFELWPVVAAMPRRAR